jgi:hypothetical protein
MLIFPTYESHRTLAIVQPAETTHNLAIEKSVEIRHFRTLCIVQPVEILLDRVFIKENTTSSLRKVLLPSFFGIQATDPSEGNK